MKKYTLLVLMLCMALLAGCGLVDKAEPSPSVGEEKPTQSTTEPRPEESEQPSDDTVGPPDVSGSKPNESYPVESPVPTGSMPEYTEPPVADEPADEPVRPSNDPYFEPYPDVRADAEFVGEWFARKADSSGELRAIKLVIGEDGAVSFNYGVPYSEVLEVFEGRWREDGELLVLELRGGPTADDGSYEQDYCRDIEVYFRWEEQGIALICEHTGGNPLLPGTSGEWFTLRPFDAFQYGGTWSTSEGSTEYRLQLKENGGCIYSVIDVNGTLQAEYDGSWRYKNGQISMSVDMCGGAEYDMGRCGQIAGTYTAEGDQNELHLTCLYGSELTPNMADSGSVSFVKR